MPRVATNLKIDSDVDNDDDGYDDDDVCGGGENDDDENYKSTYNLQLNVTCNNF